MKSSSARKHSTTTVPRAIAFKLESKLRKAGDSTVEMLRLIEIAAAIEAANSAYADAQAAYQWLRARGFSPEHILVWGESLGGGIASQVAATLPVGGLALQSSFTSIPDIGAELFPWLPVRLLSRIKYDTLNRLPASFFVSVAYNCWAYRRRGVIIDLFFVFFCHQ